MNSANQVDQLVEQWKQAGLSKEQIIVRTAEAELGWPYVWGAVAALCTPSKREYYAGRSSCPQGEKELIISRCPALASGKSCTGCTYYPNNARVQINDCQGFVKQLQSRVGITLSGGGATSMWDNNSNWSAKGPISEMPPGQVCCVFMWNTAKQNMSHVGEHVGQGQIIHCSGTVKRGKTTDKGWTHYAIPKGLSAGGDTPMPWRSTVRYGSRGDDVRYVQETLQKLGYDIGASGVDGIYGKKTEAAVKDFQKAHGLVVDGICGPMTYQALQEAEGKAPEKQTLYTVTIPHCTKELAEKLKSEYTGVEIKEE